MNPTKTSWAQRFLPALIFAFFLLTGAAYADSTTIAWTTANWASASFSGAVVPVGEPNNSYATLTEAYGWQGLSSADTSFRGTTNTAAGWGTENAIAQFGPATFSLSSAGDELTNMSTAVFGYSVTAQTERSGSIVSTDGDISISVPYSFSITTTTCCDTARTGVWIYLYEPSARITSNIAYQQPLDIQGSYSNSGTISINATGLPQGNYLFDVGSFSQITFVDEPGTLTLMSAGLAVMFLKKRFARVCRMHAG